jgi:YHS domain-containing protein
MQVEYKGKSYPVCCSGCAAAFKDDPERWLAKLAEKE